jgi:hypothetical protein
MTVSANVCARLSAIRASMVGGQRGALTNRDVLDRFTDLYRKSVEDLVRTFGSGLMDALNERNGIGQGDLLRPWGVEVTSDCPRSLVVIRVGWKRGIREVDTSAIE